MFKFSLDIDGFDDEHRTIVADWGEFLIFNVYFPNGKASKDRLEDFEKPSNRNIYILLIL